MKDLVSRSTVVKGVFFNREFRLWLQWYHLRRMDLGDASQKTQASDKGKKRERHVWSLAEEAALLDILEEMVNKGKRCDNGTFKSGSMTIAEQSLHAKFPRCGIKALLHIESKLKVWKDRYNILSDMLAKTGFGWNDEKNCVEVDSDDVWDSYVQANKEAAGWRGKPFPMYEKLSIIFGKDRANEKAAKGPGDNDTIVVDEDVDVGLQEMDITNSVSQSTSKRAASSTP